MLNLYDIHTHRHCSDQSSGYNLCSFVNIYPFEIDKTPLDDHLLKFSCGVHPWYMDDYQKQLAILNEVAKLPSIVAIGEVGFDRIRKPDVDDLHEVFTHHALLGEQYQKPLIIHCVKAWDELIAMHKKVKPTVPWIIHGYRGNPELTEQLAAFGFKFSIGERYNKESVEIISSDSLFCETDMSIFSILQIYQQVAEVRNISLEQLVEIMENNVKMTFCK